MRAQLADLPFRLPAVFVPGPNAGLASPNAGDRLASMETLRAAAREAMALGVGVLVIEPGVVRVAGEVRADDVTDRAADWSGDYAQALVARRGAALDQTLDRACRALFDLSRAVPDLVLALSPSRKVTGLGAPGTLATIFEDLPNCRLEFWANPAIAACRQTILGEDPGVWLEQFADRMAGITLSDAAEQSTDLPPGAGVVDYGMVASYLPREATLPGVVELDPAVPVAELAGVHSFLAKFGL
ncbi:MAG: hypothetical protein KDB80_04520 [Planctomycetes bacterium]|nr:hypothetical protein [Planctomycetota bacterium]